MAKEQDGVVEGRRYSALFVLVALFFVTCLITANITAGKNWSTIFGFVLPAGTVIFPISYIFGDVLTEVYGYRQARLVIWLGFLCNLITVNHHCHWTDPAPAPFGMARQLYNRILGLYSSAADCLVPCLSRGGIR